MKPSNFNLYIYGDLTERHYKLWKASLPGSKRKAFTDDVRAVKVYKQKEGLL